MAATSHKHVDLRSGKLERRRRKLRVRDIRGVGRAMRKR